MVSVDQNGNGLPDDEWFELKGYNHNDFKGQPWYSGSMIDGYDMTNRHDTYMDYEITYFKPSATDKAAAILWEDNKGNTGEISPNKYHSNCYYPLFVAESAPGKLTFKGT